ncbi:MAG: dTDP-4-dehydrorhamnose 3,5-epimerase [Nitrospirota bacterium]|nr:dTDP-4-dehydrorhamnose 3,5-epimerase [Nitrospirota bacterium]
MRFIETALKGVVLIEIDVFPDERGHFFEISHAKKYAEGGIAAPFVQSNFSRSCRGTLRGLHYQLQQPQGKLVTVVEGTIFDVAVDIQVGSPTFGQYVCYELSVENKRQLYIPPGYAHGVCALTDTVGVVYNCTDFYSPKDERGILWSDPAIGIAWPVKQPLLSPKDAAYKTLADMAGELPVYRPA